MKLVSSAIEGMNKIKVTVKEKIYAGSVNKTIAALSKGSEITINELTGNITTINDINKSMFAQWNYDDGVVILQ
jgi:spermidine/putrescine transport system ATP-binding protein